MTTMTESLQTEMPVPAGVRRKLINVLFAGQGLFSAAQIISFGVLPLVAVQMAHTDAVAGLPSTVTLIGRAVAAYPVGWLMDKLGRRFGLSLGFLLCTVASIFTALAIGWGSFFGFMLGVFVAGMGRGIGEQARFAAAEVEEPNRRAKAIGFIVFASTIGAIVGPSLMASSEQVALYFGFAPETGPFLVASVFFYLALMLTILFLRPDPLYIGRAIEAMIPKADGDNSQEVRPMSTIFGDWNVRLALVSMTVGQLVMTVIMTITPLHMERLGYTIDDIGWVLMAHTIGMFALSSATGWLIDRVGLTKMIGAGALLLTVVCFLTPIASTLWLLCGVLFMLGLGWNFCFVAGSALLSDALRPNERGRIQGASETLVSFASGIGSLSVGFLFTFGGMIGISSGSFVFTFILVGAMIWVLLLRPRLVAVAGD